MPVIHLGFSEADGGREYRVPGSRLCATGQICQDIAIGPVVPTISHPEEPRTAS
jgi:hypothetical protein